MGAPKELTGPTTVKGRVGSLKSISMSDDLVGWYNRLLVLVPEPIVHADRMTAHRSPMMIGNFFIKARLLTTRRYAAFGDYPWIDPSQFSRCRSPVSASPRRGG